MMDGEDAELIDVDLQLEAGAESAAAAHAEARQLDLHTFLPGIIQSYDETKQTVTVQPAISRIFETGPVSLPLCVDVPVVFPAGGGMVMTFPIAKNDECLLVFAERAIDNWWDRGGVQLPSEFRLHDLSDGFAIVGISSKPRFLTGVNTTACELRTRDGSLVLRFGGPGISLGVQNVQPVPLGNTLNDKLGQMLDAIQQITVPTGMGPSGTPLNSAQFAAIKAALGAILSGTVQVQP